MSIPFSRFSDYFMVVAKTGNLRKAADQLHISASAVHRQIALAEEELDIALFERLPNGLKLTLAGEMLYSDVLRWQKEYKQTCMRFDEIQGLKRGAIELGLIAALSDGFVVDVLATLQSEFPWITLNILTDDSDVLINKIITNEIDVGLILDPVVSAQLDVMSFVEIPIGLVMCPDHPLAQHTHLTLSQTLDTRLLSPINRWLFTIEQWQCIKNITPTQPTLRFPMTFALYSPCSRKIWASRY